MGSLPPFAITGPSVPALPVLLAVPHAGRDYPADQLARLRHPAEARLRLEDRLVDQVAAKVAASIGVRMITANTPRALIDLNRDPADIDWSMVDGSSQAGPAAPAHRWPSGLGLIPRRVPGMGELWRDPLSASAVAQRIEAVHTPYHTAIETELALLQARFGAALLIDVHSMPPLPMPASGDAVRLVVGDRLGASAARQLSDIATDVATDMGIKPALNHPYAGGYVLARHGQPKRGRHSLQVELCRSLYLDDALAERGPGFDRTADLLAELVARLGQQLVTMINADDQAHCLPQNWPQAAE